MKEYSILRATTQPELLARLFHMFYTHCRSDNKRCQGAEKDTSLFTPSKRIAAYSVACDIACELTQPTVPYPEAVCSNRRGAGGLPLASSRQERAPGCGQSHCPQPDESRIRVPLAKDHSVEETPC